MKCIFINGEWLLKPALKLKLKRPNSLNKQTNSLVVLLGFRTDRNASTDLQLVTLHLVNDILLSTSRLWYLLKLFEFQKTEWNCSVDSPNLAPDAHKRLYIRALGSAQRQVALTKVATSCSSKLVYRKQNSTVTFYQQLLLATLYVTNTIRGIFFNQRSIVYWTPSALAQ